METGGGEEKARGKEVHKGATGAGGGTTSTKGLRELRRHRYASDEKYANRQKENSRRYYRKTVPLPPSKLRAGLLVPSTAREVICPGIDGTLTVNTYTLPEAAAALGRSALTFKKWIKDGMVPPPRLADATRNHRLYSEGELLLIAQALAVHERSFAYYGTGHTQTILSMSQRMHGYRQENL